MQAKKLYALDFDGTIPPDQVHNLIQNLENAGDINIDSSDKELMFQQQWAAVEHIKVRGKKDQWKKFIEQMQDEGNIVAIVSFNNYPKIIKEILIKIVGLDAVRVNDIHFETGLPEVTSSKTKILYIRQALAAVNERWKSGLTPNEIVFVDDNFENYHEASNEFINIDNCSQFTSIWAMQGSNNFFDRLAKTLENPPTLIADDDQVIDSATDDESEEDESEDGAEYESETENSEEEVNTDADKNSRGCSSDMTEDTVGNSRLVKQFGVFSYNEAPKGNFISRKSSGENVDKNITAEPDEVDSKRQQK